MRVLSEANDDTRAESSTFSAPRGQSLSSSEVAMMREYHWRRSTASSGGTSKRQLYASILPDRASIPEGKATGVCQVGWESQQCTTFPANDGNRVAKISSVNGLASLMVMGMMLFWLE
jgi:hypothetical protein